METQFYFDQMISLCHILMRYENIHFSLSHSSNYKHYCSELTIYFDFDDDEVINSISDFVAINYPYFCTNLIIFKKKDPFKVLKVQVK